MSKAVSRNLFLIGLVIIILYEVGLAVTTSGGSAAFGNAVLATIAAFLNLIGTILIFVALIGALVKTARLRRWGWFVCLLLFTFLTMLLYIFVGPQTRPGQQAAPGYAQSGYPQPGYPPQSYPPQ